MASRYCSHCLAEHPKYTCPCHTDTFYCGKECAASYWTTHKYACISAEKRGRDELEGEDVDPEACIVLQLQDGEIVIDGAMANKFVTLRNLIQDAGTDAPIPVPNIRKDIMRRIVSILHMHRKDLDSRNEDPSPSLDVVIDKIGTHSNLVEMILALNYLDASNAIVYQRLSSRFVPLISYFCMFMLGDRWVGNILISEQRVSFERDQNYRSRGDEFESDDIRETANDLGHRSASLPMPSLIPGQAEANQYTIVNLTNDIMLNYVLPLVGDNGRSWTNLHRFRMANARFYRVTTRYMVSLGRREFPELQNIGDADIFRAAYFYFLNRNRYNITVNREQARSLAMTPSLLRKMLNLEKGAELPKSFDRRDLIVFALLHYGSFDKIDEFVQKKADASLKQKATKQKNLEALETRKNFAARKIRTLLRARGIRDHIEFGSSADLTYKSLILKDASDITAEHPKFQEYVRQLEEMISEAVTARDIRFLFNNLTMDRFQEIMNNNVIPREKAVRGE